MMAPTGQTNDNYSKGNPRIPKPGTNGRNYRIPKKLIVLCDGTGQDSYGDTAQNPTNITRLARALAPKKWIKKEKINDYAEEDYEEWDQIVSYHAGVGTFAGNNAFGIMFGDGLSEIVRAAYGFLANNWQDGDKIYIFGFSRGAYIARAIAGLVADHGLLTKRAMDNFHAIYESFYMSAGKNVMSNEEAITAGLRPLPPGTVEVVGVFDTVGFHAPIQSFLRRFKLDFYGSDKNEMDNTVLSENVKYAFHALSLDEERIPFQATLFFQPKDAKIHRALNGSGTWKTQLEQVWFSGAHSDIGGGMQDPRLSNITLAWMIDKVESLGLLAFDKSYLLDLGRFENVPANGVTSHTGISTHGGLDHSPWPTSKGPNPDAFSTQSAGSAKFFQRLEDILTSFFLWLLLEACKFSMCVITWPGSRWSRWWTGRRTPGRYIPIPRPQDDKYSQLAYVTNESLHSSLKDRVMLPFDHRYWLGDKSGHWRWPYGRDGQWRWIWAAKGWWPCKPLWDLEYDKGDDQVESSWTKKRYSGWFNRKQDIWANRVGDNNKIEYCKLGEIEIMLRDKMRFQPNLKPWIAEMPITIGEVAVPIRN